MRHLKMDSPVVGTSVAEGKAADAAEWGPIEPELIQPGLIPQGNRNSQSPRQELPPWMFDPRDWTMISWAVMVGVCIVYNVVYGESDFLCVHVSRHGVVGLSCNGVVG